MKWRSGLSSARILLRQFRWPVAVRILVFEGVRKLLDPDAIVTYAQTGEDRVIDYYVGYPERGFYVDVGCHHPSAKSNTLRLYKRGWSGLCIDANPDCIRAFRRLRPRDIAIHAAISNECRDVVFTEFRDRARSSLDEDFVRREPASRIVAQRRVQTQTLTEILRHHVIPTRFDLLSIDCEGHDYEVVQSLDFDVYRPRVIAVEMHGFDLDLKDKYPIPAYLHEQGYCFRAYSTMNGYFTDRTESGVGGART